MVTDMGYKDDLFHRLKEDGTWDQASPADRVAFEAMTDEQARLAMTIQDGLVMRDPETAREILVLALPCLLGVFNGALMVQDQPGLTRAGHLLAEFFLELAEQSVAPDAVAEGLRVMEAMMLRVMLVTLHSSMKD